eukprot:m.152121 g.152121  ORF g.152121 m.152121 type:complete len:400 (-) comp9774_c0_seq6:1422-2621(-)
MWHRRQKKEAYNTDHSRVVSHHSTTSAQRRLTAESGRDPVHSPWYDRRHREEVGNALCMVFGTMSADARMKVYADASVTSWPAQPAQPALAASKVVSISHIRQTRCHEVVRLHDRCGCCINWLLSDCFPTCAMTPAEKLKHWEDKVARNDAKTTDMDKEIEDVMARINELKAEKKKRALDDDERAELATLPQDLHDLNAKLTAHLNVSAKDTAILDKLLTQQGPARRTSPPSRTCSSPPTLWTTRLSWTSVAGWASLRPMRPSLRRKLRTRTPTSGANATGASTLYAHRWRTTRSTASSLPCGFSSQNRTTSTAGPTAPGRARSPFVIPLGKSLSRSAQVLGHLLGTPTKTSTSLMASYLCDKPPRRCLKERHISAQPSCWSLGCAAAQTSRSSSRNTP